MIKKLTLLFVAAVALAGCSSTVTLGPEANSQSYIGATAGATVTLPFVKGEVGTTAPKSTEDK